MPIDFYFLTLESNEAELLLEICVGYNRGHTADHWRLIFKIDRSDMRMHVHPGIDTLLRKVLPDKNFKGK